MFEAFILSIVMCRPDAISIDECSSVISRVTHATETDCVVELMEQALPWVISQGQEVLSFSCGPYPIPFNLDDPV